MTEWACRTYGWSIRYIVYEMPLVQLAMLYRSNAQGVGGLKSSTLLEEELGNSIDFEALSREMAEMNAQEGADGADAASADDGTGDGA